MTRRFTIRLRLAGCRWTEWIFLLSRPLVESARKSGQWLVLAGHEIARSGRQTTRIEMLEQLIPYLQDSRNGIWFETVETVTRYIQKRQ